jgi:hypothetical protein
MLQEDSAKREVHDQSDSGKVPSEPESLVSATIVEWGSYDEVFAAITAAL